MKNYNICGHRILAKTYESAKAQYLELEEFSKLSAGAQMKRIQNILQTNGIELIDFTNFCKKLIENGKTIGRSEFVPSAKKRKKVIPLMVWNGLPDSVNF